jgi:predicted alpha/beta hydrolase
VRAMEDATIRTTDGYELPATLFEDNAGLPGNGPLVLISSAAAVPRRFYSHFAQYLADNGARAAMTYDYRGMNGGWTRAEAMNMRMSDWALRDLPAAAAMLQERYADHPLAGLGHSFGGQAFGLSGTSERFLRFMTIAAGSGYLGHTDERDKLHRRLNWFGLPLAAILGYLPGWAGMGEPIPYGAFNQWRKWCNSPDYFMSDASLPQTRRFAEVRTPMVAIGFHDDPWATRPSVEALISWHSRAGIRLRWFGPEEHRGPIGHLGFFRRSNRDMLWPQIADWLVRL